MQNRLALVATLMTVCSIIASGQKQPSAFAKMNHFSGKDTLRYALLKPETASPNKKYPLILFLHGAGERGRDNQQQVKHIRILMDDAALNEYPCFILAPQCPQNIFWSDIASGKLNPKPTRQLEMVMELLERTLEQYPIDTDRIYITGVSMGGFATWDLIARRPERFAAAIPICGGGDVKTAAAIKHIPIWAFHGALDEVVSPNHSRKMIQALQNTGGVPKYTEYPNITHNSWTPAYKTSELLHWLFSQRKGQSQE